MIEITFLKQLRVGYCLFHDVSRLHLNTDKKVGLFLFMSCSSLTSCDIGRPEKMNFTLTLQAEKTWNAVDKVAGRLAGCTSKKSRDKKESRDCICLPFYHMICDHRVIVVYHVVQSKVMWFSLELIFRVKESGIGYQYLC